MIVYDVVKTVTADAASVSSHEVGRHLVNHFDDGRTAQRYADRCNECRRTDGITYDVEAIDELSPLRVYDHYGIGM